MYSLAPPKESWECFRELFGGLGIPADQILEKSVFGSTSTMSSAWEIMQTGRVSWRSAGVGSLKDSWPIDRLSEWSAHDV